MAQVFETGRVLIRLDDAIRPNPALPLGYPPPIVNMLAQLRRLCGLHRLEIYWPLGLSIPTGPPQAPPGIASLRDIVSNSTPRQRRTPPPAGWSPHLESAARLRLLATVAPGKENLAVQIASKTPGVRFAERLALRRGPSTHSDGGPSAKVQFNPRDVNKWAANFLKPPPAWGKYQLNNIAVFDSGCQFDHPTYAGRVVVPDDYSKYYYKSQHATFICGQLIGAGVTQQNANVSGRADLPAGYGLFPSSKLYLLSVEDVTIKTDSFALDNSAYSLGVWTLANADAQTRTDFSLDAFSIKVLNLSIGNVDPLSKDEVLDSTAEYKEESELLADLEKAGITVVACSHNIDDPDNSLADRVWYPAAFPNVLSVAAVDSQKTLWAGARTKVPGGGKKDPAVNLCAPGVDIWSSSPINSDQPFIRKWSGTSFAAPYVTAAAAVLHHLNPKWTPSDVRAALTTNHHQATVQVSKKDGTLTNVGILHYSNIKATRKVIRKGDIFGPNDIPPFQGSSFDTSG